MPSPTWSAVYRSPFAPMRGLQQTLNAAPTSRMRENGESFPALWGPATAPAAAGPLSTAQPPPKANSDPSTKSSSQSLDELDPRPVNITYTSRRTYLSGVTDDAYISTMPLLFPSSSRTTTKTGIDRVFSSALRLSCVPSVTLAFIAFGGVLSLA
jgi:hypothetical protein